MKKPTTHHLRGIRSLAGIVLIALLALSACTVSTTPQQQPTQASSPTAGGTGGTTATTIAPSPTTAAALSPTTGAAASSPTAAAAASSTTATGQATATTAAPTATSPSAPTAAAPTATNPAPTTTAASAPGGTTPTAATAGSTQVDVSSNIFLDDRSDPVEVVRSLFNAVNRKEYVRAYYYWGTPGSKNEGKPQPYQQFEQGYASTESVQLFVGKVFADAGAGQRYFSVPVTLKSKTTGGANQTFVGCYVVRWSIPSLFGAPPFIPMHIESANVKEAPANADTSTLMAQACQQNGGQAPGSPAVIQTPTSPTAIDASRYLDDRSSAEEVLRSYYNAINRKEYVRAYSYWSHPGTSDNPQPPAYPQFEQGYQDTASVDMTLGTVKTGAAAGSVYYSVPVTLVSKQTNGTSKTFAGCYTVRQPQPRNFGAPPFTPMGIESAKIQEVPANGNATDIMNQACSQP